MRVLFSPSFFFRGMRWQSVMDESVNWGDISVQFSSATNCVQFFETPWTAACQASLSIPNFWSLLKLMPIMSVMPSSHLILCVPFSSHLQSFPASGSFQMSQFFASGGSLSFNIIPSNEYSGLISFRMDLLDLLAVQGSLESLLQHHSSKASIHQCSAFFIARLSHPYMTTVETIPLTRWSFVGKVHLAWCQISSQHTYLLCHSGCAVYYLCGSISSSFK